MTDDDRTQALPEFNCMAETNNYFKVVDDGRIVGFYCFDDRDEAQLRDAFNAASDQAETVRGDVQLFRLPRDESLRLDSRLQTIHLVLPCPPGEHRFLQTKCVRCNTAAIKGTGITLVGDG